MNSKGADKFTALWNGEIPQGKSHSDADMSLATLLAFWCGRDLEQMDRLFRKSGLMRDKWDRQQSGTTYGSITLEKAAASVSSTYAPITAIPAEEDFEEVITQDLKELKPFSSSKYPYIDIGNSNLFIDYAKKWQTRRTREIILRDAQDVHPIAMSEFDTDIYSLNCKNGTLNLKTGNFYKHKATDYITKVSGVNYDPIAKCERWETFITEVMSGDVEKAEFLQKSLGYALTGDTCYETMFILFGATTRNGKGTLMETFLKICGDYGKTCKPETIGMKSNNSSSAPSEDVARLAGARFVNISEPDKKLTLGAALLKTLTGNDTIMLDFCTRTVLTLNHSSRYLLIPII